MRSDARRHGAGLIESHALVHAADSGKSAWREHGRCHGDDRAVVVLSPTAQ